MSKEKGWNKYNARKVTTFGHTFDSTREAVCYLELRERLKKGEIKNLRLQVPFELLPEIWEEKVVHLKTKDKIVKRLVQDATTYIADFVYEENGVEIVVDAKGYKTEVYKLKKKMMRALLGIDIKEV
jgi:Protein of unknown function (DUF1064).